jgi:hypothetical protein
LGIVLVQDVVDIDKRDAACDSRVGLGLHEGADARVMFRMIHVLNVKKAATHLFVCSVAAIIMSAVVCVPMMFEQLEESAIALTYEDQRQSLSPRCSRTLTVTMLSHTSAYSAAMAVM